MGYSSLTSWVVMSKEPQPSHLLPPRAAVRTENDKLKAPFTAPGAWQTLENALPSLMTWLICTFNLLEGKRNSSELKTPCISFYNPRGQLGFQSSHEGNWVTDYFLTFTRITGFHFLSSHLLHHAWKKGDAGLSRETCISYSSLWDLGKVYRA